MKVITRAQWGARYGNGNDVSGRLPWGEVVVHTEAGAQHPANNEATEAGWIRAIESFHCLPEPRGRGWSGIAYSFLICPSGRIFEGRGWGRQGAHTETRNSSAAGVCFIGHGDKWPATENQWASAWWLIGEGIRLGKLTPAPKVTGHRDYSTKGKTCPGNLIYPQLHRLRGITGPTPTKSGELTVAQYDELKADIGKVRKAIGGLELRLIAVQEALGTGDPDGPLPERIRAAVSDIDHRVANIDRKLKP